MWIYDKNEAWKLLWDIPIWKRVIIIMGRREYTATIQNHAFSKWNKMLHSIIQLFITYQNPLRNIPFLCSKFTVRALLLSSDQNSVHFEWWANLYKVYHWLLNNKLKNTIVKTQHITGELRATKIKKGAMEKEKENKRTENLSISITCCRQSVIWTGSGCMDKFAMYILRISEFDFL